MRFRRSSGGVVEFGKEAVQTMLSFRQISSGSAESGGMLLGRLIDNNRDIVVDEVSVPRKADIRRRFFFFRKREPAQKIVESVWKISEAATNYLGEWHTLPEDVPSPSTVDLAEWSRIAQKTSCEQDVLIFVIVGRVEISAWEVSRRNQSVSPIVLISAS